MLSRSVVANHAAKIMLNGNTAERQQLVEQLAAWLKINGKTRQTKYLVNDIAKQMSQQGYVLISITTARTISSSTKLAMLDYLKGIYGHDAKFEIIELTDMNVIGGVLIDTPNGILDLTIKNKLKNIIKGASL